MIYHQLAGKTEYYIKKVMVWFLLGWRYIGSCGAIVGWKLIA